MKKTLKHAQRGVVTVIVMMILVAGVLFILSQSNEIVRTRGVDTSAEADSAAAFMLAESGLARARSIVTIAQTAGSLASTTCDDIATGSPFTLGSGTFSYSNITALPAGCGAGTCDSCSITATGKVNGTERTLTESYKLQAVNGTAGRGTVVRMVLKNTYSVPAIALFNLSWRRQGQGGNADSTLSGCTTSSSCQLLWNLESSSGKPSVGGMGTSVPIDHDVFSQPVIQTLDLARDYVEVGGLFPSVDSSYPVVKGSFWSRDAGGSANHTRQQNATFSGSTNSGVVDNDTTTCLIGGTVPNPPGNTTKQTCNRWCKDSNILVFGFSGRSSSFAAEIPSGTQVTFNTTGSSGYPAQNILMNRVVHFPNTDGSTSAASGQVYSEVWWAANPLYNSTGNVTAGTAAGATSYSGAIIGTAGASVTFNPKIQGSNTGNLSLISGTKICVGDPISGGTIPASTTISRLNGSNAAGTCANAGTTPSIELSATVPNSGGGTTNATVKTTSLQMTSSTAALSAGAATVLASGTSLTIVSGPDGSGVYTLSSSTPAQFSSGYVVQGTGLGTTMKVASTTELPASTGTMIRIYSKSTSPTGSGVLAAQTTVTAIDTANKSFTISTAPTTAVIGAKLCAGTCAFFNDPSNNASQTTFTFSPLSGSTTQWAGGFMCLSGVDSSKIIPVTSSAVTKRTWSEAIQ
jgi:hypothetical protein